MVSEPRKKIINRLRTIKGHIAGIEKMVEDEKPCDEILVQIAAIKSSVNKVGLAILENNAESCMLHPDENGKVDQEEVRKVMQSFINFTK
ncbi:metal-sensitive transcriptional regulator [Acidaminobacter sp. JC074]|uniref:metal-sensitive transcriptional regulator n=1 Tax=Acidaminobacter sp. JC074 TaxID=2530199 RepID=UPI001F0F064E|nr:metal-sensitive transcriptional regulator [Acidaminobacter sp. JC074]MCH4891067.1 metal-sensitive transcriptional regulator [Acidaminobacter sp. JC074]